MSVFEEQWRARFERYGRVYADEHAVSGWSAEGLRRRVKLFHRLLAELDGGGFTRVLDLGCGGGTYVRALDGDGRVVVGVDYSIPTLRRAIEADLERRGRYLAADAYRLPFRSASFDLILSIGVLQALSAPEQLVDEVARLLRAGGVAVIEALNPRELPAMIRRGIQMLRGQEARVRTYRPRDVRHWLEERGLEVVGTVPVYLPPRRWPQLGQVFDRPITARLGGMIPGCSDAVAHAFWFVGRKSADGRPRPPREGSDARR